MMANEYILSVENINAGYGKKQVLSNVSMTVEAGKITVLIGPNGSGKSTVLKTVCGLLPVWNKDGAILFKDQEIQGNKPSENIKLGITFSPQGNQVFDRMTVQENLEVGGFLMPKQEVKARIAYVLDLYPMLKGRLKQLAGTLSGGEQQMLALARALMPEPDLLILDEPSLGLSPALVNDVFEKIVELNEKSHLTILIVEQRVRDVLKICHNVYGLKLGKVAFQGTPDDLTTNPETLKKLFL
ncbi:MAG: ABC transporter ATP-binding protein [Kiritimatiellae bacterium]|jgi:branched-chain amino acid transport system ATP-binding protein|nr:ABC transporter ATP-binding protein [Kiritimatiellia bacterium]